VLRPFGPELSSGLPGAWPTASDAVVDYKRGAVG